MGITVEWRWLCLAAFVRSAVEHHARMLFCCDDVVPKHLLSRQTLVADVFGSSVHAAQCEAGDASVINKSRRNNCCVKQEPGE